MTFNINATNFTGVVGSHNSTGNILANSGLDVQGVRALVVEMRKHRAQLIEATGDQSLSKRLGAIEAEIGKASVDKSRITMLLADIRNALSGATGNVVAAGALALIGKIIGG